MKIFLLSFSLLLSLSIQLSGQCYSVQTLLDRVGECDMVVTAEVLGSEAFYNEFGQIDTRHKLLIYETWLGDAELESAFMVTRGGQINEELTVVRPSLYLNTGDLGVFLLRQDPDQAAESDWHTVAVQESFLAIDTTLGVAYDQDTIYEDLDEFYALLDGFFPQRPQIHVEITKARDHDQQTGQRNAMMPAISSFSPTSLSAGTGAILTINGSGFGSTTGTIFFDSPDDGTGGSFISAPAASILSWTNNQVRVNVTGQAGTGRIQLRTSNNQTAQTSQNLLVTYAVTSLNASNGTFPNPRLVDDEADGDGGYTYFLSNSTANGGQSLAGNAQARAALERALNTWQEDAGYAIYAGVDCGVTSVQEPIQGDGINVISFDNGAYDLDTRAGSGTVGIAFSYYSACGSSQFEMTGNDIIFRRNGDPNGFGGSINWFYGTGNEPGNQTNFESVALHEIGHTHQLNHVNDPAQIMNFRVLNGQSIRDLSSDDLLAAGYMSNLATSYNPPIVNCGGDFNQQRRYTGYDPNEDCGESALPVRLTSFTGTNKGEVNQLNWATAGELNNDYFIVERSKDGRNFEALGQVAGNGTTDQAKEYELVDTRPLEGNNYYRLSQVDFDGSTYFSNVILLTNEVARFTKIAIVPNPFTDQISVTGLVAGTGEIVLLDVRGRIILRQAVNTNSSTATLLTNQIPSGVYWLRAGQKTMKVVKR